MTADKIGEIYKVEAGPNLKALPDIIALIISIFLPIIQGCIPKHSKAEIASATKDRPIASRVAYRLGMREVGCKDEAVYRTMVSAGLQATEGDVTDFLTENEAA